MDTPPDFVQFLATMGVGGILAAYAFYINNRNQKEFAETLKSYNDVERGRTDMLVSVVRDVSSNITKNTVVTESLHRRLDREEYNVHMGNK